MTYKAALIKVSALPMVRLGIARGETRHWNRLVPLTNSPSLQRAARLWKRVTRRYDEPRGDGKLRAVYMIMYTRA